MKKTETIRKKSRLLIPIAIVSVLFAIVAIMFLCKQNTSAATPWRYYDEAAQYIDANLESSPTIDDCPVFKNVTDPSPELQTMVDEVKSAIRRYLGDFEAFDWERFEHTVAKEADLPENPMMIQARYEPEEEVLYLVRDGVSANPKYTKEIICHELIHSLAVSDENADFMGEGVTERLAQEIYPTDYLAYVQPQALAEIYDQAHGRKALIDAYLAGTLADKIDEDLGRPVMHHTEIIMAGNIDGTVQGNHRAFLDVYVHYMKKMNVNTGDTLNLLLSFLSGEDAENYSAVEYYREVLNH